MNKLKFAWRFFSKFTAFDKCKIWALLQFLRDSTKFHTFARKTAEGVRGSCAPPPIDFQGAYLRKPTSKWLLERIKFWANCRSQIARIFEEIWHFDQISAKFWSDGQICESPKFRASSKCSFLSRFCLSKRCLNPFRDHLLTHEIPEWSQNNSLSPMEIDYL